MKLGYLHLAAAISLMSALAWAQAPGAHWTLTPTSLDPPLRKENPGVSDGTYMYVFGGNATSGQLNDLWRFDGTTWVEMTTNGAVGSPPARDKAGITWDYARNRLVVFGGGDSTGSILGDTWEWDPVTNTWADVTPTGTSPLPRRWCALAYDQVNSKVLLFGGLDANGSTHLNDTWQFDGLTWTQLNPTGPVPAVRRQHALVERPDVADIILCGGQEAGGAGMLSDTWSWDGSNWNQINTTNVPAGKVAMDAAYDQIRQRIVIASGMPGPTGSISEFDSRTNDWVIRPLDPGIYKVTRYFMAYVPALGKTYKVSGQALNSSTPPQYTYEYQSDNVGSFTMGGNGCAGTVGTPLLLNQGLPWVDSSYEVIATPVGTSPVIIITGFSDQSWLGLPLPLDLSILNAPGCMLYTSIDVTATVPTPTMGASSWTAPIPNMPFLAGVTLYHQAMVMDPGTNGLGWIFSSYGAATIGVL